MLVKMVKIRVTPKYSLKTISCSSIIVFLTIIQIRRVDLDCLGVDEERERRRLQAAVRELGIQGATQVFKII